MRESVYASAGACAPVHVRARLCPTPDGTMREGRQSSAAAQTRAGSSESSTQFTIHLAYPGIGVSYSVIIIIIIIRKQYAIRNSPSVSRNRAWYVIPLFGMTGPPFWSRRQATAATAAAAADRGAALELKRRPLEGY